MRTILHLATSSDGFIATSTGDSDWVSATDEKLFVERVRVAGCVAVGKTTFDQYKGKIYPVPDALNIVLTHDAVSANGKEVVYASSPTEAIALAEKNRCNGIVIAGGAKTAGAFLDQGLVDEIFLSVHPIELRDGIRLLHALSNDQRYTLVEIKALAEGVKELHYTMV